MVAVGVFVFTSALLSGNGERADAALHWASWILILAAFLSFTSGLALAFLAFARVRAAG